MRTIVNGTYNDYIACPARIDFSSGVDVENEYVFNYGRKRGLGKITE